jgi:hypothetical protein
MLPGSFGLECGSALLERLHGFIRSLEIEQRTTPESISVLCKAISVCSQAHCSANMRPKSICANAEFGTGVHIRQLLCLGGQVGTNKKVDGESAQSTGIKDPA